MSDSAKQLMKEMARGKNLDENMSKYVYNFANLYYKNGLIKGAFEYYTLYEQSIEMNEEEKQLFSELLPIIQKGVSLLLLEKAEEKELEEGIGALHEKRKQVMEKVDVLSAYVDRLQIYEYVLNRMELKYKEGQGLFQSEEEFSKRLMQYIFSMEDNMIINERIKEVISQLPVRITKNRYFDWVRSSLSIYKGCEKSSVEDYLYRFNTSAMLYEPKGERHFSEYAKELQILQELDYGNLSENEYSVNIERIKTMAASFIRNTDFYIICGEFLNSLYASLEALSIIDVKQEWKEEAYAKEIFSEVYHLFETGGEVERSVEEKLILLEGKQEAGYNEIARYEGMLFDMKSRNQGKALLSLEKIGKLMSSSIFIDLDKVDSKETADENYINEKASALVEGLERLFKENRQQVNRGIMANTMKVMPVFFNSTDEISDYIQNSLDQCRDFSEKNVSMNILNDVMEEI